MVSCNTTLVPSLGFHIGPDCEASLSTGMRREHVPPNGEQKKERNKQTKQTNKQTNHHPAPVAIDP